MKVVVKSGKVVALHHDIQDVSNVFDYRDCVIVSTADDTAIEVGQAWAVSLADAVASRIAEAAEASDAILAPLAARFGVYERDTWPAQLAEARALLADPTLADVPADTTGWVDQIPTIRTITAVTGEELGGFAAAVVKNNDDWLRVTAHVAGQRQAAVARLKACATLGAVLGVSLDFTLPS